MGKESVILDLANENCTPVQVCVVAGPETVEFSCNEHVFAVADRERLSSYLAEPDGTLSCGDLIWLWSGWQLRITIRHLVPAHPVDFAVVEDLRRVLAAATEETACLLGGRADGWAVHVPAGTDTIWVTMVAGVPRLPPADVGAPGAMEMLQRSRGRWEIYRLVAGLGPDGKGRLGYWAAKPLELIPGAAAALIAPTLMSEVERQLHLNPADPWGTLRYQLAYAGYELAEPVMV